MNGCVLLQYLCHEMIWPGIHRLFPDTTQSRGCPAMVWVRDRVGPKNGQWNPGFGIFNFNSLIIFMLSLISTFLTLIVLWSILNFDNLDIKRKYDDHPKIIYSFVTVLENSPEWSPSYAFQRWCEITTNRLDRRKVILIFIMHNLCIIIYGPK